MAILEVFNRFLFLGCLSFGGPAAHIGYFQNTFVTKHAWLNQEQYAKLVALSQFLPGPGSSQVGFAIGLHRAGLLGGLAAFIGFTLPSFSLMLLLAYGTSISAWESMIAGAINGLKLLAVVVVADAIISMYHAFCKQWFTGLIAFIVALTLILMPSLLTQVLLLSLAGILGVLLRNNSSTVDSQSEQAARPIKVNWFALGAFVLLFIGLPLIAHWSNELRLFSDFYHAGSLVFGGGHVVLPLLQHTAGEALNNNQFLTGYAAAQALPGPMFTLATYLGAQMISPTWLGALIATMAIFLPGFLLVIALKEGWQAMLSRPNIAGATWGINAAIVGLLMAAFYQPVLSSAINNAWSAIICVGGLLALRLVKCPILILVLAFLLLGYWL